MNGKQLKNSILQWAIQGKLVPQDPNDEPASVLLERIREEKAKLVKEKKIKKDKNESIIYRGNDNSYYEKVLATGEVKCIDDEIPFEIPATWEWCRFSSIYKILTDGTHSTPHYTESGVPFLSVKDMSAGYLNFNNTKFISESEHVELSKRCHPQKGDLLLSKVGTTGIPLIIDTDREFSIFVSLALVKFTSISIDRRFLISLINSPLIQEQVKENTRGVGNKNWVLTAIANTLMLFPPLKEQSRIADKIDSLLPIINKYSKTQQKLEDLNITLNDILKKSILQEAIQGKLVPQIAEEGSAKELLEQIRQEKLRLIKEGKLKKSALTDSTIYKGDDNKYYEQIGNKIICIDENIPFEIPINWSWCRLGNVITISSGENLTSKQMEFGGIPVYGGNGITGYHSKANVFEETIVIGRVGYYCGSIHLTPSRAWVTDNAFITQYSNLLNRDFLILLLKVLNLGKCHNATAQPVVSGKKIYPLLVAIPPLAEQYRIVAQIEKLFEQLR